MLVFDKTIAEEHAAQQTAEELEEARKLIARTYSRDERAQQMEYARLQNADPKFILAKAQQIRLSTQLRLKSKAELREMTKPQMGFPKMPDSIGPGALTDWYDKEKMSFLIQKYGVEQVNARLGYGKPEVQGNVQEFGAFFEGQGISGCGQQNPVQYRKSHITNTDTNKIGAE